MDSDRPDVIVYVSPFTHCANKYSDNLRRNLAAMSVQVKSATDVWRFKCLLPGPNVRHVLLLSWIEETVLRRQRRWRVWSWVVFAYKLIAMSVQPVSIIWIRHNYRVHAQDVPDWVARLVTYLLESMADQIVVHSQHLARQKGWHYLPHPLYQVKSATTSISTKSNQARGRVVVLGQLRPSKRLEDMIRQWPKSVPLLLAGKPSSNEYARQLEEEVNRRGLDAKLFLEQLSADEFTSILSNAKATYVANPDETMIVSGVFFHAASVGVPVILRNSKFASEMATTCHFAVAVQSPEELESVLCKHRFPSSTEIKKEARKLFGQERFEQQVNQLLAPG